MSRWFRFYDDALNNRKAQSLPGDLFKLWVNILCIASKHSGTLPSLADVAFGLRLTEPKAAVIVGSLAKRELLDPVEGGYFRPHDWDERQYKSDVSNERVKRHRERKRNGACNVTETLHETPPETEQNRAEDDDDAGARPLISDSAKRLSDEITKIAGHDLEFVPPSWFGAPYRAQQWLNQGWPEELILVSVREQVAKKRDGPANSIKYFESGIATAIARQNQPLPVGNVTEISRNDRNGSTAKSGLAAIDRIFDRIETRPGISAPADENAVLSLPARSIP